jgi:hypothetical protein
MSRLIKDIRTIEAALGDGVIQGDQEPSSANGDAPMIDRTARQIDRQRRAVEFCRRYADVLGCSRRKREQAAKRILVIGGGASSRVEMELCLVKALELSGCWPMVLIMQNWAELRHYYSLLPTSDICFWSDFCDPSAFQTQAEAVLDELPSFEGLLAVRRDAVRIGGHATSSARRQLGVGTLDPTLSSTRSRLVNCLANSLASAAAINRIIQEIRPSLVLTEDTAYTPRGEILDACVDTDIPVIRWYTAHKSSALILKRYTSANRDGDLNSLSKASWRIVREMDWGNRPEELHRELRAAYINKDWYSEDGAQFEKRILDVEAVRSRLGLNPSRKAAFVFPHIGWDASFGRGQDLFQSYDEWLVATVKAACANDKLQWVLKVHPAHTGKVVWGSPRATDEEKMLSERIGTSPSHVTVIPARSDISTYSLFPIMDYCVTVRGTVGIEAACAGIPVLTGGAGRYDRKGFTIDSVTPDEYLKRIANIQDIPALAPAQIELAQRFAYGLFLLRPLPLSSVEISYDKNSTIANLDSPVNIKMGVCEDWVGATDLMAFANWATNSDDEDFLLPT